MRILAANEPQSWLPFVQITVLKQILVLCIGARDQRVSFVRVTALVTNRIAKVLHQIGFSVFLLTFGAFLVNRRQLNAGIFDDHLALRSRQHVFAGFVDERIRIYQETAAAVHEFRALDVDGGFAVVCNVSVYLLYNM